MAEPTDEMRRRNELSRQTAVPSDDPDVIKRRIEETRAEMSETVGMIQEKLSPENVKEQALTAVREATVGKVEDMANTVSRSAQNWRANVMETVRENPIPAAMVGLGLGWLIMESRGDSLTRYQRTTGYRGPATYETLYGTGGYGRRDYGREGYDVPRGYYEQEEGRLERVRSEAARAADEVRERAGEMTDEVRERAGEMADEVRERTGEVADQTRRQVEHLRDEAEHQAEEIRYWAERQAREARGGYRRMMNENPLALGAIALAAGAFIGLVLPATEAERELMGETRDRFVRQAQEVAQETAEKVQHVAEEAGRAAKETAQEEIEKQEM